MKKFLKLNSKLFVKVMVMLFCIVGVLKLGNSSVYATNACKLPVYYSLLASDCKEFKNDLCRLMLIKSDIKILKMKLPAYETSIKYIKEYKEDLEGVVKDSKLEMNKIMEEINKRDMTDKYALDSLSARMFKYKDLNANAINKITELNSSLCRKQGKFIETNLMLNDLYIEKAFVDKGKYKYKIIDNIKSIINIILTDKSFLSIPESMKTNLQNIYDDCWYKDLRDDRNLCIIINEFCKEMKSVNNYLCSSSLGYGKVMFELFRDISRDALSSCEQVYIVLCNDLYYK